MYYLTYGDRSKPAILMIHGMAVTALSCYEKVLPYLKDYYVVLCEVDGHSPHAREEFGKDSDFTSIKHCCTEIESYVKKELNGRVRMLVGFSMGATIAVSLLGRRRLHAEQVLLDAAFCVKMGFLTPVYTNVFRWGVRRLQAGQTIPKICVEALMGKDNTSILELMYRELTGKTIYNVCHEIYTYEIPEGLRHYQGKVTFWHGSRERYPRKTVKLLSGYLYNMTVTVFPNMGHGQFLYDHPEEYGQRIRELLS